MAIIELPIIYVPDPLKGRPLFDGQIFVGEPDTDPEVVINQKQLNVVQEDGTVVAVGQPFVVGAGGVPIYQNQTVRLDTDGNYSLKILDRFGAQKYYIENVFEGDPVTEAELPALVDDLLEQDLSQAYEFATVAEYKAFATLFPAGKVIHLLDRKAEFTVGSDVANTWNIIDSDQVSQSITMVLESEMTTKQFGLLHDGTEETAAMQNALDTMAGVGELISSFGQVGIDPVANINIPSKCRLTFEYGSSWKALNPTDATSYIIMDIRDVQDVIIWNPVLIGDKDEHVGATGEQGHCLNVSETDLGITSNIHIHNPICTKAWGDGIVVRKGRVLHFYNSTCEGNRRNGYTVSKGIDVYFHGDTRALNTSGIAPEAGFDFEPDDATGDITNVIIDNLVTRNNTGPGLTINIGDYPDKGSQKDVSITIHRHEDNGSVYGLNVEKCAVGATSKAVTFTDTGDLVNLTAHGFIDAQIVYFATVVTTTGIEIETKYFVVNKTTNNFQVALEKGGSALPLTTDGSGTLSSVIRGNITIDEQIYTNSGLCGLYFNDYGATNTPLIRMKSLNIFNPNRLNNASNLFGAGIGIDRNIGSGLTNNIGNCIIERLIIRDSRAANQMTRGIGGFDNDSSGAELENFKIINPIEISGYDAAGDAVHMGYNGMELTDKYEQVGRVLAGSLSVTSRSYSKLSASDVSMFTVTDGITKDNAGLPLELFTTGAGGIRFDPQAARQVYPLNTLAGDYIQSVEVGARIVMKLDTTDDTWYIQEMIGTWTKETP